MQKRKYVCRTADNEHCFDLSGLVRAVGVTGIYSRQYIPEVFLQVLVTAIVTNHKQKTPSQVFIALSKCQSH